MPTTSMVKTTHQPPLGEGKEEQEQEAVGFAEIARVGWGRLRRQIVGGGGGEGKES